MRDSIRLIKQKMEKCPKSDPLWQFWEKDPRKGVQQLIKKHQRALIHENQLKQHFQEMCDYETKGFAAGYRLIAGIDEVGRGPLAGPVVAAAVIFPQNFTILGLDDSKKLSHEKREILLTKIREMALAIGIGQASVEEIDQLNIYEATKVAMMRAVEELDPAPDYLLLDAMRLEKAALPQEKIIKGDMLSVSIAAASIVAKESRDRLMIKLAAKYPGYGLERNMGYGTKEHLAGLAQLGATVIHRKTFAPVKAVL